MNCPKCNRKTNWDQIVGSFRSHCDCGLYVFYSNPMTNPKISSYEYEVGEFTIVVYVEENETDIINSVLNFDSSVQGNFYTLYDIHFHLTEEQIKKYTILF